MESGPSALPPPPRRVARLVAICVKIGLGLILLVALFYYGSIYLGSLRGVTKQPDAVVVSAHAAAGGPALVVQLADSRPAAAGMTLLHVQAISAFTNQFLLGTASADAVRGIYAWRALRGNSPRIALSLVADRVLSLAALMLVTLVFMLLRWDRVSAVAPLTMLLVSVMLACGAMAVAHSRSCWHRPSWSACCRCSPPLHDWPRSYRRSVLSSWRFAATYRPRRRLLPPRWSVGPSISWRSSCSRWACRSALWARSTTW
jgi:hypothetical protein